MPTYLVTGGAGFIGGAFVRQAVAAGHVIVNLDKLTYAGNLDSLASVIDNPQHRFVQGDIADDALVAALLEEHEPAAIVNFAAESHVDRSIDSPDAFIQTNVVGTWKLLEAARGYYRGLDGPAAKAFRFLHVSTDEVYGSLAPGELFVESTPYAPNSPYSASKAASDHFVRAYHHTYGLPTLITNCSNNYGPYQFPEKLIPLMILNAVQGRRLPVYGDGQNVRDWLFVDDHTTAIQTVLDRGRVGQVYNIGGDCPLANLDVVHTLCDLVDRLAPSAEIGPRRGLIQFVTDRPGHDRRYAIDATKIKNELGWRPRENFATGLERTVRWYLDNAPWVERVSSGEYRRERLGLARAAS